MFVVRKGNPKQIRDWDDLTKPSVAVIRGHPKTSNAARWAYLAAYGHALGTLGSHDAARERVAAIYKNAPVLDSGARGMSTTFAQR